jgi:LL-diaminopimelate aminotransferase
MVKRNKNIEKLQSGYLFPEIGRRKKALLDLNPSANIISLGIGNTTEPLTPHIVNGLKKAVEAMGTEAGYAGYDDNSSGCDSIKKAIAEKLYNNIVQPDEIHVSDGSKCDIGRLQTLFGSDVSIAVQDPSYPVYVDGSVIAGATGFFQPQKEQFDRIHYMTCKPENNFFPDLDKAPKTDLIYFCSPNNPTGAVATKQQLKSLVDFAKKNGSIIIFDAAYAEFISDPSLPKSIFEIEGAREVAIEGSSFSKTAGFTGVRLSWTIVPKELKYEDGTQVSQDWSRVVNTIFNGASNIVQKGGVAALEDQGLKEMKDTISFYMENAKIIKAGLESVGIKTYGGTNAPYIWASFPGKKSWDIFSNILEEIHVVTTPGAGFGPGGESYVRFSAFGNRKNILEAVERLKSIVI